MDRWISDNLSNILKFEVPQDLIGYIQDIQNESDLNEYLKTLLDFENPEHKQFFLELTSRKFPRQNAVPASKNKKKKNIKTKGTTDINEKLTPPHLLVPNYAANIQDKAESTATTATGNKKKSKFVNLYSQEGANAQVIQLKGRHHCDCQATKHGLVNNCLTCGRIVCKQEGSGPCLFCGSLVCTPQEQREINAQTKASVKLKESLLERNRPKGWEAALLNRDRLLDYDKNSEQRTRVTDDDSDYFNANSVWLSATERDKLNKYQQTLQEKKHASRLTKKMTFDFAGRQIIEDNTIEHEVDESVIREITNDSSASGNGGGALQRDWFSGEDDASRDVAHGVNADMLQFDPSVQSIRPATHVPAAADGGWRVQDASLQEMSDAGRCMSMHQPWASLLVEGIKMHEGRSWYTNHRGRLWIASTAKPAEPELIKMLENRYRVLYPEKEMNFPSFYPAGCLLGCVNVDDCLPQEEYRKIYPEGDSDSPFVFICSNPISLKLRFPVKGQHKIYTLDKLIHQAAVKSVQKMSKLQAQANAG